MFRHEEFGRRQLNAVRLAAASLAALALVSVPVPAQSLISARAGLVDVIDGAVFLAGKQIQAKPGHFVEVKEGSELVTTDGRAEVLLNPGVFLRLGERSSMRMVRSQLADTRIELLTGSAVIEAAEIAKDSSVSIECKGAMVLLKKAGIYRFDLEPARLRVFAGNASVRTGGRTIEVGGGKMLALEGESASIVMKFKKELTDELDRWSRRRGELVAMANVSSAKTMLDYGYTLSSSLWRWNQYFGFYTFVPAHGNVMSPYGYRYWSPGTVGRVFYNPPASTPSDPGYSASSPSYQGMSATSSGYSGTAAASNSGSSSSPAASSGSGTSAAASAGSSSVGQGASGGGGRGGR